MSLTRIDSQAQVTADDVLCYLASYFDKYGHGAVGYVVRFTTTRSVQLSMALNIFAFQFSDRLSF